MRAMKKFMLTLAGILFATASVSALSYEESRNRAWYLTDKMAYELNLTPEQYDKAYEINLNYFLNVNYASDIDGPYWRYRNQDMGYVLFDWQFGRFESISYFYHPLIWRSGICIMTAYDHYERGFYYFNRPIIYNVYRGVSWRKRPRHSPYRHMTFSANGGMRDRYGDRGHGYYFRNGERFDAPHYNGKHYGRRDNLRTPGPDFDKGMMVKPEVDHRHNNRFDNRNNGRVYGNGGNYRDKIENGGRIYNGPAQTTDRKKFPTGNISNSGSNNRSNYGSSNSHGRNNNSTPNRFGTRTEASGGNGGRSFSDRIRRSSSNSRSNVQNAPESGPSRNTPSGVRSTSPSRNSGGNSGGGNTRTRSFGR